jgi:chromosome segregation ATPase
MDDDTIYWPYTKTPDQMLEEKDAEIKRLRTLVEAKDLLLSEWLGEEKAQLEIERLRADLKHYEILQALANEKDAEIERLRADRDSWADQADARVKDCVEYISEIERLRKDFTDLLRVAANDATAFQAEIERLRAEVEPLRIALGLLTTIKPTMEIDITDPVGMAQQIAAHVAEEIERLDGVLLEYSDVLRLLREGKPIPVSYLEERLKRVLRHDKSTQAV